MVLDDSPRAYWRFGETSGTTAADELVGAPGTYQGGVALGLAGALANDTNTAAGFDGSNDQVNMGDPADERLDVGTQDFSLESWVYGTQNNGRVIASKRSSSSAPYWRVTIADNGSHKGHVRATVFDGVATVSAYGPSIRVDNWAWHHVVVAFDRDVGVTIWVDGVSRATSGAFPRTLSNSGAFVVGKSPTENLRYFQGSLDEVALYPSALPEARVIAHRSMGLGTYRGSVMTDGPRAYWRLGESSGTIAFDELGTAHASYQNGVALGALGALITDSNRAAGFDGSNDQVNMGDPSSGALDVEINDFSLEAWVKGTANAERVIAAKRSFRASDPYWRVTVSDDAGHVGEVRANVSDGVAGVEAYGPAVRVDDGVWHHVAVVFDRDVGVTVWVDGLSRATAGAFPRNLGNSGGFMLGKSTTETMPYFQGSLDEVAFYQQKLSAPRVAAHRNAGLGLLELGLGGEGLGSLFGAR